MRSKAFCFTWNNYSESSEVTVKELGCRYVIYGREVGESGTPHLQGYLYFHNQRSLKSVIKKLKGAHVEIAKGSPDQNRSYCSKSADVFEFGVKPLSSVEKGEKEKLRWQAIKALVNAGKMDELSFGEVVRHDKAFERQYFRHMQSLVPDFTEHDSEWWWGPTGSGKSRTAQERYPDAYRKMCNKWWDDYKFEPVVVIDDLDPTHELKFGAFLKHYADHQKTRVEFKGGSCLINPMKVIVTSQYCISGIFKDVETVAALSRRFKVTYFPCTVFNPASQATKVSACNYP